MTKFEKFYLKNVIKGQKLFLVFIFSTVLLLLYLMFNIKLEVLEKEKAYWLNGQLTIEGNINEETKHLYIIQKENTKVTKVAIENIMFQEDRKLIMLEKRADLVDYRNLETCDVYVPIGEETLFYRIFVKAGKS